MAEARVVRPDRRQLRWDMIDLEGLLPADHRARLVWRFVESLDLSPFTIRFSRARAKLEGRRPIPRFYFRCGFTRRSKAWGRRANWSGLPKATPPIGGWREAGRSIITGSPTSGSSRWTFSTGC